MTSHMQDLFRKFRKDGEYVLEQISKLRETTVFPILFHIQASMAPWVTSRIYDRLNRFGQKIKGDVDIVLFSGGGDPDTAFHIGKILNRITEGNLTYIIPRYAASAATLLALSGNKILMGPPSELSPIDPQIEVSPNRFVSAHSVRESFNLIFEAIIQHPELPKSTVEALLEKLPITEVVDYDRLLDHTEELALSLLKLRMIKDELRAKEIANKLVRGYKHHARSISIDDAIELGLEVEEPSPELWNLIWEFHKKWEPVASVLAKEGSNILVLDIGNGIAFIPSEIAEEEKNENRSLQSLLNRM